jgi:chromosome segregation protein
MYLKRLTMKGFKSFADPTTLELEPGVTVVVGPNGSGKSNVVDAVTWVLGAQGPRALRSAKMEDVIFAGTASRPQLGRAEVSLTIDNADSKLPVDMAEVTISRTLFRSGDSEYAINGAPCRLLDIQELLSDSGVGRQQHMIIGQGQLDTVLNARPEDRRSVIEEAAGVLKHRRRKERAERRLAATQENLERLGDLVREVRRQMRPLERQAVAARSHGTLSAERDLLRLHLAGRELSGLLERAEAVAEALATGADAELALRGALEALDAEASSTTAALAQDQAEDLAQSVAQVQSLVERARGLSAVLEQRSRRVAQALEASADADVVASLEADSARLAGEVAQVDREVSGLEPEREALREAEAAFARAQAEYEATWGGGHDDDAAEALSRAQERLELLERAMGVRQGALADLEVRRAKAAERRQALELDQEASLEAVAAAEARAVELARGGEEAAAEQARRNEAQNRTDEEARLAESAAARSTARAESLSRALDELTGGAGREALKELEGVVGSLVDLLIVDAGWERAVEAAAGAAVAAIVVDSRAAARHALERLRQQGASGLVIAAAEQALPSPGGLPPSAELVRRHVRLRPGSPSSSEGVLDRLFGDAVRVASLEAAMDLALERPELVVVTSEGDRFSSSGWRVSAGVGVVTAAAVEQANAEAADASALAERLDAVRREAREAARASAEAATGTQREADRAVADLEARRVALRAGLEAIARLADELAELELQIEQAGGAVELEAVALRELRQGMPELEGAAARAEERALWAAEARATLDAHRSQVQVLHQELEVHVAELTERRRTLVERRDAVERRLEGHVEARTHAAARRERLEDEATAVVRLGQLSEVVRARLEALLESRRSAYAEELRSVRASGERLEALRSERSAAQHALETHQGTIRALEIESAELAVRREQVVESIRHELGVEPERARATEEPELPEGVSAAERAAALEAQLEALGPINPLALEELSALEERHQDLERQVGDVREARRELHEVVRALDEEIMQTFASAAADVNEHFSTLVAMLFPGGQGRLVLTEPDDLLGTGVEIEVRPAGRNVRRVSLLSGGERSMAALAFLFAVFRSRPSPFYLMDEVEAALDDVNLHRFLGLIREFRHEAQLIIVSHQKRTMETGDALYGVTMKPGGSSQVVSQRVPASKDDEPAEVLARAAQPAEVPSP